MMMDVHVVLEQTEIAKKTLILIINIIISGNK